MDRAERGSIATLRVRPLNLIRIMPVEENFSFRPSDTGTAFFCSNGQGFSVQRFKNKGFRAGFIGSIGLIGSVIQRIQPIKLMQPIELIH
jgi:hypothetical protein